jgi:hypothetical protein
MAELTRKPTVARTPTAQMRRSTRVPHTVLMDVSGKNYLGLPIEDRTSTLSVNYYGCSYQSRYAFPVGTQVTLGISRHDHPQALRIGARVKSVRLPGSPTQLYRVGVELEKPGNVWGLPTTPPDWQDPGQVATRAVPAEPEHAGPVSQPAAGHGAVSASPEQLLASIEGKLEALVTEAVRSAAGPLLKSHLSQGLRALEEARDAGIGQLQEAASRQLERMGASSQDRLSSQVQKEVERARTQLQEHLGARIREAEQASARLAELATAGETALAQFESSLTRRIQEADEQCAEQLATAQKNALARLEQEADQLVTHQTLRLSERQKATIAEVATHAEYCLAEVRSKLESGVSTALAEFQRRAAVEIELGVSEVRKGMESALASYRLAQEADTESHLHEWKAALAQSGEQAATRARQQLDGILESCVLRAAEALHEQTASLLKSLTADREKNPNAH